jgi:predicted RNA binding protein YcfA (HicA-like mRNA interferase family)
MPPRWNEYRKVIGRNGFTLVRSKKHETWVKHDDAGRVIAHTTASHGNDEIRDKLLFKALLKQCQKTEGHFYEVLKRKGR